jgi:hypothetical protein
LFLFSALYLECSRYCDFFVSGFRNLKSHAMQQSPTADRVRRLQESERTTLPDIKLSHSGYLIYANAHSIDFLRKVSEKRKISSIGFLISEFPMMLMPGCKATFHLEVEEAVYEIRVTSYRLTNQVGLFISKQLMPAIAPQTKSSL